MAACGQPQHGDVTYRAYVRSNARPDGKHARHEEAMHKLFRSRFKDTAVSRHSFRYSIARVVPRPLTVINMQYKIRQILHSDKVVVIITWPTVRSSGTPCTPAKPTTCMLAAGQQIHQLCRAQGTAHITYSRIASTLPWQVRCEEQTGMFGSYASACTVTGLSPDIA